MYRVCSVVISFSLWLTLPLSSVTSKLRSDSWSWASNASPSIRLFHFSCSRRPCSSLFRRSEGKEETFLYLFVFFKRIVYLNIYIFFIYLPQCYSNPNNPSIFIWKTKGKLLRILMLYFCIPKCSYWACKTRYKKRKSTIRVMWFVCYLK